MQQLLRTVALLNPDLLLLDKETTLTAILIHFWSLWCAESAAAEAATETTEDTTKAATGRDEGADTACLQAIVVQTHVQANILKGHTEGTMLGEGVELKVGVATHLLSDLLSKL